jgi:superfamily II DNA or RNA helicase
MAQQSSLFGAPVNKSRFHDLVQKLEHLQKQENDQDLRHAMVGEKRARSSDDLQQQQQTTVGEKRARSSSSAAMHKDTQSRPQMVQSRTPHHTNWKSIMHQYLRRHPGYPCDRRKRPSAKKHWLITTPSSALCTPPSTASCEQSMLHSLYWVPVDDSGLGPDYEQQEWFRKDVTMQPNETHRSRAKPRRLYRYHNDKKTGQRWLGVPPIYGQCMWGASQKDLRSLGKPLPPSCSVDKQRHLDELQSYALTRSIEDAHTYGGAVEVMACGGGKTGLGAHVIHQLGRKALIVVPGVTIANVWLRGTFSSDSETTFDDTTGTDTSALYERPWLFGVQCVQLRGQYKSKEEASASRWREQQAAHEADIVVTTIQTLYSSIFPQSFLNEFGTVLFDEVHHMNKPMYSLVLEQLPMRYRIGKSATPDREDGHAMALYYNIGPLSFFYERTKELTGLENLMHVVCIGVTPKLPDRDLPQNFLKERQQFTQNQMRNNGNGIKFNWATMKQIMGSDPWRLRLIVLLTQYVVQANVREKTVIFTEYCSQSIQIAKSLQKILGCTVPILFSRGSTANYWDDIRALQPDDAALPEKPTGRDIDRFQERMYERVFDPATRVFIGTDKYLDEGFNCPNIDCVVFASDLKDVRQHLGRTQRPQPNKQTPLCIDVYSNFHPWTGLVRRRQSVYRDHGFQVDQHTVYYSSTRAAALPDLAENARLGPAMLFAQHQEVPTEEAHETWLSIKQSLWSTKPVQYVRGVVNAGSSEHY